MKVNKWNNDLCALLRQWWEIDGMTSRQVSAKFGEKGYNVTRNAVIGKVHRMGLVAPDSKKEIIHEILSQRAKVANVAKARLMVMRVAKVKSVTPRLFTFRRLDARKLMEVHVTIGSSRKGEGPVPDGSKAVLLKDAPDGVCKAIIGYVGGEASMAVYCGEPAIITRRNGREVHTSWCSYHASIYQTEPRK
jgi:hypothetical protein